VNNKCILEEKPELSVLYSRVRGSRTLNDILEKYESLPDYSRLYSNDFNDGDFRFLNNIDISFLDNAESNIKKMNINDNIDKEELDSIISNTMRYINCIISFIKLSCNFTNINRKDDMIRDVSSRLFLLLPKKLSEVIKISTESRIMIKKLSKLKALIDRANYYDLIGDLKNAERLDIKIKKISQDINDFNLDAIEIENKSKARSKYWKNLRQKAEDGDPKARRIMEKGLDMDRRDRDNPFYIPSIYTPNYLKKEDEDFDTVDDFIEGMFDTDEADVLQEDDSEGKSDEVLQMYGKTEMDILDNPGDPFGYIFDEESGNYIVVSAPEKNIGAIGYEIERGTEAYNVLSNRYRSSILGENQEEVEGSLYGDFLD